VSPALRRLGRDRTAVAFGTLFLLLTLAFFAAPLYASEVAHTTFAENRLSGEIVLDGKRTFIVSLEGVPIGPTWEGSYFLGADENGRDLMVRLLYGGRNSLIIGACAVLLTVVLAVPLALVAGYFRGRVDALVTRLLDLIWSFPALLLGVLLGTAVNLYGLEIGPVRLEAGSLVIPIAVIGIVYVPYLARPLRGDVLALREQHFVEAARACGMGQDHAVGTAAAPVERDPGPHSAAVRQCGGARVGALLPRGRGPAATAVLRDADRGRRRGGRPLAAPAAGAEHRPGARGAHARRLRRWPAPDGRPAPENRAGRGARAMILFAARRLGWALLTALIASIAAFTMFWAIPNVDPEYWLGGAEKGNDATRARAIEQYGLDDPLPEQYCG
jgi:ABC-type dipeptide/oligopeptide/nickel transport system permease subunit